MNFNTEQIAWLRKQELGITEPLPEKEPEIMHAIGHSVGGDDMHWTVNCPKCEKEFEYKGFFDSTEETKCKCGCYFVTDRMEFDDDSYIL